MTETDKELLELAAKAVGGTYDEMTGCITRDGIEPRLWNPLTDDGDALRLAVKLRIIIDPYAGAVAIPPRVCVPVINEGDHCKALRQAIVRAAAEI